MKKLVEIFAFFGGLMYAGKLLAGLLAVLVVAFEVYSKEGFSTLIEFLRLVAKAVTGV